MLLEHVSDLLLDGVHSLLTWASLRLWLLHPIQVLLLEDEAVWSLLDQVIIFAERAFWVIDAPQHLEPPSQISLLDLVQPFRVILVRELVDHSPPLLQELGSSRHCLGWQLALTVLVLVRAGILGDRASDLAGLQMVLSDRQVVEYIDHAVNHLNWRERVVRVLAEPHLQDSAALELKEDLLDVLLPQVVSDSLAELEPVHGCLASLDSLVITDTSLVHLLDQTQRLRFGCFIEFFLSLNLLLPLLVVVSRVVLELCQQLLPLLFDHGQLLPRV